MKNIVYFAYLLSLVACKSIQPPAPLIQVEEDKPPVQSISTIQIPVVMELKKQLQEADKSVPYTFTGSEQKCEDVSYSYKFDRKPIQIEGNPKKSDPLELSIDIDGKYALNLNYCPKCSDVFSSKPSCITPRIYASCGVDEPMRRIHVGYLTQIYLLPSYKLDARTTLKEVTPKDPCEITVFNYNATDQLVKEVKTSLKDLSKEIDKGIEDLDIKKEVDVIWNSLVKPIDLQGYGFLSIKPNQVGVKNLRLHGTTLKFDAQVSAYPIISLERGSEKVPQLPNLTSIPESEGFKINLALEANYDSLNRILMKSLKGKTFDVKGKQIVFDSLHVHGAAKRMLTIAVQFSGSKSGTMFLNGTPQFNDSTQTLTFPDLTFELETKNALLKSAKWLFNDKITSMIRQQAVLDLRPIIENLKKEINAQLNTKIDASTSLSGKMYEMKVLSIFPDQKKLILHANLTGKLNVTIE